MSRTERDSTKVQWRTPNCDEKGAADLRSTGFFYLDKFPKGHLQGKAENNFGGIGSPDDFGGDNFGRTGHSDNSPPTAPLPHSLTTSRGVTFSVGQDTLTTPHQPPTPVDNFPRVTTFSGGGGGKQQISRKRGLGCKSRG